MSLDLTDFETDSKKEDEGVEVQLGGGIWIKVASSNRDAYINRMSELMENNQVLLDMGGKQADDLAKEALYTAAAEHLLLDWNMPIDGKAVKYTPEIGKAAFVRAAKFYRMVKGHADSMTHFALHKEEKETKNS